MSGSALWEALGPIAARMPKVVREHEILRVAATVHGNETAKSAEAARREVLGWAQRRSGGRLPRQLFKDLSISPAVETASASASRTTCPTFGPFAAALRADGS
jgi:hypothetical protein